MGQTVAMAMLCSCLVSKFFFLPGLLIKYVNCIIIITTMDISKFNLSRQIGICSQV